MKPPNSSWAAASLAGRFEKVFIIQQRLKAPRPGSVTHTGNDACCLPMTPHLPPVIRRRECHRAAVREREREREVRMDEYACFR